MVQNFSLGKNLTDRYESPEIHCYSGLELALLKVISEVLIRCELDLKSCSFLLATDNCSTAMKCYMLSLLRDNYRFAKLGDNFHKATKVTYNSIKSGLGRM